jgi:hypothetical protein
MFAKRPARFTGTNSDPGNWRVKLPVTREMPAGSRVYIAYPKLDPSVRKLFVFLLLLAGLVLQYFVSIYIGTPFILIASWLSLFKGIKLQKEIYNGIEEWERVTAEQIGKAQKLIIDNDGFISSIFNPKSGKSGLLFIGILLPFIAFSILLVFSGLEKVFIILIVNGLVLFIPLIFMGGWSGFKVNEFKIKLEAVNNIRNLGYLKQPDKWVAQPYFAFKYAVGGKKAPVNCRMMFKLKDAPDDFIGVQAQISINRVQGRPFPYLYCCVIAKRGLGLTNVVTQWNKKMIMEWEKDGDVDIMVIRQETKGQGYFTKPREQRELVIYALKVAEEAALNR